MLSDTIPTRTREQCAEVNDLGVLGDAIPHHPFTPGAPAESRDIPLVVSTVLDERTYRETRFDMTWDEVLSTLQKRVGDDAQMLLSAYRDETPAATKKEPTPLERLQTLDAMKALLSQPEYEEKRAAILAAV